MNPQLKVIHDEIAYKTFKYVPALCASTGNKNAQHFCSALLRRYMVNWAARTMKFILFMAMLFFGATSVPRIMFLLFLPGTGAELPEAVVKDVLTSFAIFILVSAGFIGISIWLRKQEDAFS